MGPKEKEKKEKKKKKKKKKKEGKAENGENRADVFLFVVFWIEPVIAIDEPSAVGLNRCLH